MGYGDFKDLAKRAASDKVSRDRAFNIAKNLKYNGYQRGLASMVYNFLIKSGDASNELKHNEKLTEELHKSIIKKF